LLILVAAMTVTACGSQPDVDVLARYAPIEQQGVSTDVIQPEDADFQSLLGEGWEPLTKEVRPGRGRMIIGRTGDFRFYAVLPGPYTLELEGFTPIPPPRTQSLAVRVNGQRVGAVDMAQDWTSHRFSVPAEAVLPGWNDVQLRFSRVLKPGEIQKTEERPLAASFRRLRVRAASDRPDWEERPNAIQVRSDTWGTNLIEMPADSVMDAYVDLGKEPRLVGAVDVTFAKSGPAADLNAAVDLIDQTGESHPLFARTYTAGRRESFEIPLQKWADATVRLRLRAWGRANGVVQWRNTGVAGMGSGRSTVMSGDLLRPPQSKRLGRPNVVVVLLDTARADAIHSDRPDGPTPNIAALAADGTRFTEAWAPASWTGMTLPSLLSGRYPQALGVDDWGSQIPPSVPTLAELTAKGGYRTLLWGQHNIWKGNESLRRGFEDEEVLKSSELATRDKLPSAAQLFVEGRPTFAFVHLLPPHGPYTPPEPFRGALTAGLAGKFWRDPTDEPDPEWLARTWRVQKLGANGQPFPDVIRYIRGRYDENALYADHLVGRLVETIRAAGQYDNTMIVILADHGEAFFEHGHFFHSATVYQELLHVPLVVKWPAAVRSFERVVSEPVTLVDLAPTLVDGLGLPFDGAVFQGHTLLPLALDKTSLARDVFAITRPDTKRDKQLHTIRSGRYKLIYNDVSKKTELYDLVADPGELVDLAEKDPVRAGALRQRLLLRRDGDRLALANVGGSRRNPIQEETMRALRALGYVQ
jgi:arylsulfatase A-like enzyme